MEIMVLICYIYLMTSDDKTRGVIAEFSRKYLWWEPIGDGPHSDDRILAQTMNLGTFDDIVLLEQTIGQARLVDLMKRAEPGWLSDRSWEFWRGRLSFSTGVAIADEPPRRSIHAAMS
jgi:hypothetical protein